MPRAVRLLAVAAAWLGQPAAAQEVPADYRLPPAALPAPGGPHPIGTLRFEVAQSGGPSLQIVAWYPAASSGPPAPYLDADEQRVQAPAIARNFRWPAAMLDAVATGPTHASAAAPVARGRFPLLIFSHGYFLYPRQNSALMEHLASRGYVVLSLAHPGDAADLPGPGGTVATDSADLGKNVDLAKLAPFWLATDDRVLRAALPGFFAAQRDGRMLRSLARWRTDVRALTDTILARRFPALAMPIARVIDPKRIAYGGMSFGGSASASACQVDTRCRAAFNLDGLEFDQTLYDRALRMPLMLVQSDWRVFPNLGAPGTSLTHYDYAYESWAHAGTTPTIYRFALKGATHMGLTDLALAPADPVRDRLFGPAPGRKVIPAINDLVAAFLDRHLAGKPADIDAAAARHALVERRRANLPRP